MGTTPVRSSNGYIGFKKETTKGTAVACDKFIKFITETLNIELSQSYVPEGGDGRNMVFPIRESISPSGDVEFYARPESAGMLFAYAMGDDALKGTAKSGGGSGVLSAEALSGQAAIIPTLAVTLTPIVKDDILQIGASFGATMEFGTVLSMAGSPKAGGGSTTVASQAAAGQKVVNVVSAASIVGDDYVVIGAGATIELAQVDSVLVNALTMKTNLNFLHAIAETVVEIDVWTITLAANLANTQAIATAIAEIQVPYIHRLMPSTSLPWLTIERDLATLTTDRLADCKINSMKIALEKGQPAKLTMGIMGITSAEQASQLTPTYETTWPFIMQGGAFYMDGDRLNGSLTDVATVVTLDNVAYFEAGDTIRVDDEEITLGTVSGSTFVACGRGANSTTAAAHSDNALVYLKTSQIDTMEIIIDNQLQDDMFTNQPYRYSIMEGQLKVTASFSMFFERAYEYKRRIYGSGSAIVQPTYEGMLRFVLTAYNQARTETYYFECEIPRLAYEETNSNLDPETKGLKIECSGTALYTSASLPMVMMKIGTDDATEYV